jgi:hypothetical protein
MLTFADVWTAWPVLVIIAFVIVQRLRQVGLGKTTSANDRAILPSSTKQIGRSEEDDGYLDVFPSLGNVRDPLDAEAKEQMAKDKELYWILQNIENHPGE